MKKLLLILAVFSAQVFFSQELTADIPSQYDFKETLIKLKEYLGEKNLKIFAEIDHSKEAEKVGLNLAPTKVLIVGNPKVGTALMQENQAIALHLPLRILVYENNGVRINYQRIAPLVKAQNMGKSLPTAEKIDEVMLSIIDKIKHMTIKCLH